MGPYLFSYIYLLRLRFKKYFNLIRTQNVTIYPGMVYHEVVTLLVISNKNALLRFVIFI